MYAKDNYGGFSGNPYSHFNGQDMGPAKPLMGPPQMTTRTRINLLGVLAALFLPWAVYITMFALWSFQLRYTAPGKVLAITVILGLIVGLYCLYRVQLSCRALFGQSSLETGRFAVWALFIAVTAAVAFGVGVPMGSYNYSKNMRGIYDVQSLNAFVEVNPATMRGQELMDAGRVQFVAPITVNNAALASYDFWAVGKNCCSDQLADFRCGAYKSQEAKGGVRVTDDVDRDFYRLAVQQAQSAHAIKAIHPLFFEWTGDTHEQMLNDERAGYQFFLMGMMGHFLFQAVLVAIAVTCFTKSRFE